MKKLFFALTLMIGLSQISNAQLQVGVKAGVNYNSGSFKNVSNNVLSGADSRTGYHAGLWFRVKLPVIGLYLRPEVIYTELKNKVNYNNSTFIRSTNFKFRKIDVPVLLGKKVLGIGNIFAGPSFQYALSSNFGINDLSEISTSNFSLGLQFGGGIELGRLGIDVRWERSLTNAEARFVDTVISSNVNFDTRVNQIIFGLSYRL